MAGYIHTEPPLIGTDIEVPGAVTSEDAGFYLVLISSIVFLVGALTGYLA